jgi:hypothetical protein
MAKANLARSCARFANAVAAQTPTKPRDDAHTVGSKPPLRNGIRLTMRKLSHAGAADGLFRGSVRADAQLNLASGDAR